MAALLLRLRFRVLANTLRRNPVQLVAVIAGALVAPPIILSAVTLLWILPGVSPQLPISVPYSSIVVGGSAIVLGWTVVPIIVNGVEQTLDPVRLSPFPLSAGQILRAQLLVGLTWVPGGTTIVVGLLTAIAWRFQPGIPPLAALCGAVGALTAIAASRMVATLTGNLLAGRSLCLRIGVIAALVAVAAGPAVVAVAVGLTAGESGFRMAADVLAFSPVGAIWAVPGWAAAGFPAAAAVSAAIAAVTAVGVVVAWWAALRASLTHRGGGATRAAAGGRLSALGWTPATPWGAIWARSLIYWVRDPRYARQLAVIPVLPALTLLWSRLLHNDGLGLLAGPMVAATLPLAVFAGISYDGTAWAAHLAAGVRGVHDRIGRTLGLATIALPAVLVVQVVAASIVGATADLPALLGVSIGLLLSALGVVAVSSARLVFPVPRSRRNPFSASAGAGTTTVVASYAVAGITAALALPEIALALVAILGDRPEFGWAALATGLVLGPVVLAVGILLGGRMLDRAGPEVLVRLRAVRV